MKDTFPVMSKKKKKSACRFETLDNHVLQGRKKEERKTERRKEKRRELIAFSTFRSQCCSSDEFIALNRSVDDVVRHLDLKKCFRSLEASS